MKGHRFKTQPSLNQKDVIKEKVNLFSGGIITGGQTRKAVI